eukprot:CAMPEP_0116886006 /NCGR_PEP_ID=MMETSP0463-20121206/19651_1 /TAXON_ID=181622 /ORGANISM="Strombidinopsis sp, Strain SopsisLIS2011" /LENGTH=72 /DNA_ID=CAMNT_0004545585 /DNA_START=699 /DNA_END=917 /DNA_ORIENTATION=-
MTDMKPKDCLETCSTTQANEGMMRDLGKEAKTHGHFKHWVTATKLDNFYWMIAAGLPARIEASRLRKLKENA